MVCAEIGLSPRLPRRQQSALRVSEMLGQQARFHDRQFLVQMGDLLTQETSISRAVSGIVSEAMICPRRASMRGCHGPRLPGPGVTTTALV